MRNAALASGVEAAEQREELTLRSAASADSAAAQTRNFGTPTLRALHSRETLMFILDHCQLHGLGEALQRPVRAGTEGRRCRAALPSWAAVADACPRHKQPDEAAMQQAQRDHLSCSLLSRYVWCSGPWAHSGSGMGNLPMTTPLALTSVISMMSELGTARGWGSVPGPE